MVSNPLVSIVTPSFNQGQFLEETLRSVELQRHRPIYQIVIDGGSTDGSIDLIRDWEKRDHGPGYSFEWVSEPDRGHADAINKGFDRVRGEIVGWLNSDDVYFDRKVIGSSVAAFQRHSDVDAVFGEVALISENSGLQMIMCYPAFEYDRALRGYMLSQPTVFLRRSITDKYRLEPTAKGAIDFVYWLQIGKEHKFLKIPRIQAGDRDQPGRISRVSAAALKESAIKACAAFGSNQRPSGFARFQDLLWLRFMRIPAFFHMLAVLTRRKVSNDIAFPMWIDSIPKLMRRQLMMRGNDRGDLGPRRSVDMRSTPN
ncbi:MAG TPA: glycosyltransferase family 2 protein [Terracidiphilus sp.]|jgi:glycosyltransferase involved in cell wall biosynthesis